MGLRFMDIPKFTDPGSYEVAFALPHLVRWVEEQQVESALQLNPDFQRGHVWTEEQQVAYIEFLLRDGKSGRDLYFNCPSWKYPVEVGGYNDFVCVDGLQRITAITRFVHNEIKAFGHYFWEYEDPRYLLGCTLRVHVNDLRTRRGVLRWYIEMNSGGTVHTPEELARVESLAHMADE